MRASKYFLPPAHLMKGRAAGVVTLFPVTTPRWRHPSGRAEGFSAVASAFDIGSSWVSGLAVPVGGDVALGAGERAAVDVGPDAGAGEGGGNPDGAVFVVRELVAEVPGLGHG